MKVSQEFGRYFARIPLKATPHIVCDNALTLDWAQVLAPQDCSYILGNPPFLVKSNQSAAQKSDMQLVCGAIKNAGLLDFVAAWYIKAARYISNPVRPELVEGLLSTHGSTSSPRTELNIKCAFVSTNSITQGEQVGVLWSWMLAQGVKIHFAHRTFSWNNEARGKAAVHCVIIGFGLQDVAEKIIYEYADIKGEPHAVKANNINPYLVDAPDLIIEKTRRSICSAPEMTYGSMPNDGGYLLFSEEEKNQFLLLEPKAEKWIKKFVMGDEFINNIKRYCLWLKSITPEELRSLPQVLKRVEQVKILRLSSSRETTRELANQPTLFGELRQPTTQYLALPRVSSEKRSFIPIAFLQPDIIAGDKVYTIENAQISHFGILTSTMHMAWMRITSGRMKSDYSYTNQITYNNLPWPEVNALQTAEIEAAAQAVLDARAVHTNASLADLYDPLTMPANLLKAHQALDKAVDAAYGYKGAATDSARVVFLFERYQQISSLLPALNTKAKKVTKKPSS